MKKDAFTLIEIIVVIIIMAIMGTLALPRFFAQQESAIFSEGVTAANTMYGAQQRYYLDHTSYDSDAACANIDVALTPKNFTLSCAPSGSTIVSAARLSGPTYTITVSDTGSFDCALCVGALSYLRKYIPH